MSIITLQRRLREIARIRTGDQVAAGQGKTRPRKLTTFRITSADQRFIAAAADRYGGTPQPWEAPSGPQWEVYTEASEIPVVVPPTDMAFSQAYEQWSAGGCQRRCDGERDQISDGPCVCDPDKRACQLTTRLSVILHELPGLGVCRLESHGYYAAVELGGAVELVNAGFAQGQLLPARLLLEQRQVKRIDAKGKPQTRNFVVPCLDFQLSFAALQQIGTVAPVSLPVGATAELDAPSPGFTPVAELPPAPVGSIEEQVKGAGRERSGRRGGAEPIRPTGRRPRSAVEVVEGSTAASSTGGEGGDLGPSLPSPPGSSDGGEPTEAETARSASGDGDVVTPTAQRGEDRHDAASPPSGASRTATARARHVAIACREIGVDTDEARHQFLALVTDGRASSGKDLDDTDFALVQEAIQRVKDGRLVVAGGGDFALRIEEVTAPTAGSASDDEAFWSADRWREFVKAHKVTQVAALRHARAVAEQLGIEPPGGFAEWTDGRVSAAVRQWVEAAA